MIEYESGTSCNVQGEESDSFEDGQKTTKTVFAFIELKTTRIKVRGMGSDTSE